VITGFAEKVPPPLLLKVTALPGMPSPYASRAFATTGAGKGVRRGADWLQPLLITIAVIGPATALSVNVAVPVDEAVIVYVPTILGKVYEVAAYPLASVTAVGGLNTPPRLLSLKVTVTPESGFEL
jgi:hypothetical protein